MHIYKTCYYVVVVAKNTLKTNIVGTRVSPDVRSTIEKLTASQGVSISEYVRQLIISDLDKRSIFTTKLKTLQESDAVSEKAYKIKS